ncbi:MAG: hypothetical protein ABI321_12615 [Polyangia bacterium]
MTLEVTLGIALDGPHVGELADLGVDETRVGTLVLGPEGLLRDLERRLGLTSDDAAHEARVASYAERLEAVARRHGGRLFWTEPFASDAPGTARTLLSWRDALVLGGWNGGPLMNGSARLEALAWAEAIGATTDEPTVPSLPQGVCDRWVAVLAELDAGARVPYTRVQIVDPLSRLSRRVRQVLHAITRQGVFVAQVSPTNDAASTRTDLGRMQHHVRHGGTVPWLEGDGSLLVVECATQAELEIATESLLAQHADRAVLIDLHAAPPSQDMFDDVDRIHDPAALLRTRELVVVWGGGEDVAALPPPWTERERSALRAASVELADPDRERAGREEAARRMVLFATEQAVLMQLTGDPPHVLLGELAARAGGSLHAVTRSAASFAGPRPHRAIAASSEPVREWAIEVHELGGRLPLAAKDADRMSIAVHAFFAADPLDLGTAQRIAVARRILEARGLLGLNDPAALVEAHERLRAWVLAARPDGTWRRDVPVGSRRHRGTIDLFVASSRGALVIDHRAFVDEREQALLRARNHATQLGVWAHRLGGTGVVHLPVPGCVVTLERP